MASNVKKSSPRRYPIEFDKKIFPKNIQWMVDMDYLKTLPPKEQRFMAKFIREYYNGNVKKADRHSLHNTAAMRKDCYRRKNLQNRDLMSILNSGGKMDRIDENLDTPGEVKRSFAQLDSKQRKRSNKN
jgi:hypothetical protein